MASVADMHVFTFADTDFFCLFQSPIYRYMTDRAGGAQIYLKFVYELHLHN